MIGANIAIPVPIDLWISNPSKIKAFRMQQFFPALALARECGLTMVSLGASTPYACNYGKLPRPMENPYLTTGHAATAAMLKKWAVHASEKTGLEFGNIKLAVFGSAGRLGKAVSRFIGHSSAPKEILLIDLPGRERLLADLAAEILRMGSRKDLKVSTHCVSENAPLPSFDGAILVSNNTVPYLEASDLRRARFWIDDSHPRAASVEAERASRNDTLYVECYARGPDGLDTDYPFRLPTTRDCYTCFAEGYVAWELNKQGDFVTGIPDVSKVAQVASMLDRHGFDVGPFYGKDGNKISCDLPNAFR